eukprot:COSAG04_NODE_851_length_9869_cov_12.480450_5_plen_105_part_00
MVVSGAAAADPQVLCGVAAQFMVVCARVWRVAAPGHAAVAAPDGPVLCNGMPVRAPSLTHAHARARAQQAYRMISRLPLEEPRSTRPPLPSLIQDSDGACVWWQ